MNYDTVIFDMDGLMFDTERLSCAKWKKAGAEKGYNIPEPIFSEIIGSNVTETVLEDSEKGIYAALAAGMLPIMVPDLKPPSPLIMDKGISICITLDEVAKLLITIL